MTPFTDRRTPAAPAEIGRPRAGHECPVGVVDQQVTALPTTAAIAATSAETSRHPPLRIADLGGGHVDPVGPARGADDLELDPACRDRNEKWFAYLDGFSGTAAELLAEIDEDSTCTFWG